MRVFPLLAALVFLTAGCTATQSSRAPAEALAKGERPGKPRPEAPASAPRAEGEPFRVYTATGAPATLYDVIAAMGHAEAVFLGETHNDSTTHALQLRLFQAAAALDRPVALTLEMFERDVQPVLDEYLDGLIRERDLMEAARPWGNYPTDYRPLVEFAKERGLPVVAANAPQRYVSLVSRRGVEALAELPPAAQELLPPDLAPASDALAAEFNALMSGMMEHGHGTPDESDAETESDAPTTTAHGAVHGSAPDLTNLLAAQNLRDATMGYVLADYLDGHPGHLALHLNGTFHSEGGLGVPEHLTRYRPGTRTLVVTIRPDDAFPELDRSAFRGTEGGFFIVVAPVAP